MKEGIYIRQLQEQERSLKEAIRELETQSGEVQDKRNEKERKLGGKERDIQDRTEELELLQEGFVPNEELQAKVLEEIENGRTYVLRKESLAKKAQLEKAQETEEEARGRARTNFNKTYPSFNFGGMEKDNRVYDELLEQSRNNFEPEYKKQFDDQYQLVYKMLREMSLQRFTVKSKVPKDTAGRSMHSLQKSHSPTVFIRSIFCRRMMRTASSMTCLPQKNWI